MSLIERLNTGFRHRMLPVLQTEAAECGLACLVMLLGHHGTQTDLATLRRRHGSQAQGLTLVDLAQIAAAEQLSSRAVRLELDEVHLLKMPCVLHWDLSHFVVLVSARGDRVQVYDPAHGERVMGRDELSRHFSGVALEVWPEAGFSPKQEVQTISLVGLVGRVSGFWPSMWRVMLLSLALEVFALTNPLFLQWIIDHVIISRDFGLLTTLGIGFVLLLATQQAITLFRSWLLLNISSSLQVQWRSNVFTHLLNLPLDYFSKRHLGDVVSRVGSVDRIQQVVTETFVEALIDGLMVGLALLLMLLYSPVLTVVAVASVVLYIVIRIAWFRPLYHASSELIVRSANEATHLLETLRGVRTIRLFSRQTERRNAWQSLMVSEVNANIRIQRLQIFYRLARSTLSGVFTLLLLWVGAREVLSGALSLGMLLAFIAYRTQFDSRVTDLVNKWIDLRMLRLDAQRLADIVLTEAEPNATPLVSRSANSNPLDIDMTGVRFRYSRTGPYILDGIDLNIPAGQSIAIAGASGAGKTTLVHVLLAIFPLEEGTIRLGGETQSHVGSSTWRRKFGTVMQDDVLFAGSIAENISFFDPKPDYEWMEACANHAAIHDDIQRMPMGYHTLVGDMGTVLSGGQKQRVILARALYRRPGILILDEATSHLDVKREAEVNRTIRSLNVTRIVIAHRPETIASADRVVVMDNGRIVYDGAPESYLAHLRLQSASDPP